MVTEMQENVVTPRVRLKVVGASGVDAEAGATASTLYCQAQCGEKVLRTAAEPKTAEPRWEQDFTFGVRKPLGESVAFKLFGMSEHGRDVLLGSATLEIAGLEPDTMVTHTLVMKGVNGETCGELNVEVTYEPNFMAPPRKDSADAVTIPAPPPTSATTTTTLSPPSEETAPKVADAPPVASAKDATKSKPDKEPAQAPNFYVVTILEAKGIKACDGEGIEASSDPYVRVSCTRNQAQRTKTQQQTLRPRWRQRFFFAIIAGESQTLELVVEDSDLLTSDFMGRCLISLDEFVKISGGEKQVFWMALEPQPEAKNATTPSDLGPQRKMNHGLGKICLSIELQRLDRELSGFEQGEMDNSTVIPTTRGLDAGATVGAGDVEANQMGDMDEGTYDEDTGRPSTSDADSEDEEANQRAERDAQRKEREEERQKMLAELADVQFLSGDYQIRVRIIEVRDLKPMDLNGLCDPVVSVECLDQRQYTVVKQKQLSCIFDEYLYFDFKQLDKDTVQQGTIKISVLDADGPGMLNNRSAASRAFDDLIGFFSVDIPYVYFQREHELKRKWVALVGSGKDNSDSIQGYILISIVVLGPGDKLKLYDPAEDQEPDEQLVKSKQDINSMVLVPPRVNQTLNYLVVTIYRAEELPDMDVSMMMSGGIDAYIRVYFAGQDVLETKKLTVKGGENLSVTFNQELWFPVLLPTMSNNIFLSVWDWDMTTADQLVANILQPFSFKQVQKYPKQFQHVWTNLYGPPLGYDDSSSMPLQMMQKHPASASKYRGRVLLSLRVENGLQSVNDQAHVRNLLNTSVTPPTKRYTLRGAIFYGTEIPMFASKTSWNRNTRMMLRISIGRHNVDSSRAHNVSGICHWNQYVDICSVELPADLDQVPDVFVYIVRQTMNEMRCLSFARYSAKDLFCQDPEKLKTIEPPHWVVLSEDKVLDDLNDHDFTGNVLMNLRLEEAEQKGREEKDVAQQWRQYASKTVQYTKYALFVHVFQAKCLPATDFNGLLDPYVKVACVGEEGKVSTRMATRDPCYYETVVLNVELPQSDEFLPKVSLQVYDWDRYGADDYVGGLKFSLTEFPQMSSKDYSKVRANGEYSAPRPKWYPICYEKPGDTEGELLLSFDLIKKDTPGVILEPPESIRPAAEQKFVEIMCLGCRNLQPVGFMPINTPFAKFEIGEVTKSNQPKFTNPSSKPSGFNPNFLQRVIIPVKMPLDSLFAPRLNVTVYDQLLGGFYKPVIGVCSVDLSRKMPLSNGEPNPLYIDNRSRALTAGSNPYVDYGNDLSSYPGTVPEEVLKRSASGNKTAGARATSNVRGLDKSMKRASTSFGQYDDDDDDDLPHYMQHRDIVETALEDQLQSPFESYPLFRGSMSVHGTCDSKEHTTEAYRPVGRFKGIVRVLKSRDDPPLFDLDQFLNPQPYLVRVYVLDALNLHPLDSNNKCDPYLRVSLGDGLKREQIFNDRESYQPETLTPKFHKMYEFKADLPGASELRLEVLDYDFFAIPSIPLGLSKALNTAVGSTVDGDDFVGATVIDLEDRWFDAKWHDLGLVPDRVERRKPLEIRPLFAPSSTLPQGNLRLWVDILTGAEMNASKPLDISLPPPQVFEVRVIVYKAKNVTAGDFTDLSDLFVKGWLQNRDDKAQTTDTHWRAKRGRASFNWRMKFDVELPIDPEKEADRGCLHLQLWDRDVVYDDCLADAVVDLTPFLKTAFKTKQSVNVFAKPKPVRIRGTDSLPYAESTGSASRRSGGEYASTQDAASTTARLRPSPSPARSGEVAIAIADENDEQTPTARQPLLSGDTMPAEEDEELEADEAAEMENAQSLVKSFMHRLGMGDDPEDASWLTFTTHDTRSGDRVRAGELLVSVEILPKPLATLRAAGLGRSEPNNFPFLAEPADRLHLSAMWNPCYVLEALMGPKFYRAFASVVLFSVFVLLVLFAGPLINVLLTLFELFPNPVGLILFFLSLAALLASAFYLVYRCRRALVRISDGKPKASRAQR